MAFVSKIISSILAENTDDNSSETESFEECDADSIVSIRYLGSVFFIISCRPSGCIFTWIFYDKRKIVVNLGC